MNERVMFIDGGMSGVDVAIAEVVVEDEGKQFYVYGEWASEAVDDVLLCVSAESRFDIESRVPTATDEEMEQIEAERERIAQPLPIDVLDRCFAEGQGPVLALLRKVLEAHHIEASF